MNRIIGIDPGLQRTGWGVIDATHNKVRFVAAGVIKTDAAALLPERLLQIRTELLQVIQQNQPGLAAIEETFVNANYRSSLLLSQARGVALVTLAEAGLLAVAYAPNVIKKSITGRGHADKDGMLQMLQYIMPGNNISQYDAADALSAAVCHAHHIGGYGARTSGC